MMTMTLERARFLSTLPEPLVVRECDLRDFDYMPIFINRLRGSETWIEARYDHELGYVSMNLWLASWHSEIAASFEDSDNVLSEAAMCDRTRWRQIRDKVLKSWVLCNDGRWYHPVVAKCAMDAWKVRQRYRKTLAVARDVKATKADKRQAKLFPDDRGRRRQTVSQADAYRETMSADWPDLSAPGEELAADPEGLSDNPGELSDDRAAMADDEADLSAAGDDAAAIPPCDVANGEGSRISADSSMIDLKSEGRKEKVEKEKKGSLRSPRGHALRARRERVCEDPAFDQFISVYPVPMFPRIARIEWDAAIERGATATEILDGLQRHRFAENPRFIAHPGRWLEGECWRSPGVPREKHQNGYIEVLHQAAERRAGLTPEGWAPPPAGFMLPEIACA